MNKGVLRNFTTFTRKHLYQDLYHLYHESQPCSFFKKETVARVFSFKFCEISKNNFFAEKLWTTASEFVTDMLIFRISRSQIWFKIGVQTSQY